MEKLGLSGPPTRQDSIFRRIFWPSEDSSDADTLGQQGFWICLIVAILSLIAAAFQGHPIIAVFMASFYFLSGIGVREHDITSAIAVATVYLLNIAVAVLLERQIPGFNSIFVTVLLVANIRGCWIASKWVKAGDPDLIPLRMNETWRDKLVDQLPARIWPHIRIGFYVVASLALILTLAGSIRILSHPPIAPVVPAMPDGAVTVKANPSTP